VLCCAPVVVLCCCAFQHPLPPSCCTTRHTALPFSVVVRVLGEGARVTWVCWCWLSCCRGTLVLSLSLGIRSLWCAAAVGAPKVGIFTQIRPPAQNTPRRRARAPGACRSVGSAWPAAMTRAPLLSAPLSWPLAPPSPGPILFMGGSYQLQLTPYLRLARRRRG
jgi:hypothetical protein